MTAVSSNTLSLPPMLNMKGRKVLITGAAGGMGQATAIVLAGFGADLLITDIQAMSATMELLSGASGQIQHLRGDLSSDAFVDQLVASGPYYSLAHCAAIFRAPSTMAAQEGFEHLMQLNVRSPFRLATGVIADMVKRKEGYVVLVGSAAGRHGGILTNNDEAYYAEYAASKGALHTVVKWLSRRAIKSNVIVNGIAPGFVTSPLNKDVAVDLSSFPLKRAGRLEELAWPIAMMCTPASSFISGVILDVNGGAYVS